MLLRPISGGCSWFGAGSDPLWQELGWLWVISRDNVGSPLALAGLQEASGGAGGFPCLEKGSRCRCRAQPVNRQPLKAPVH